MKNLFKIALTILALANINGCTGQDPFGVHTSGKLVAFIATEDNTFRNNLTTAQSYSTTIDSRELTFATSNLFRRFDYIEDVVAFGVEEKFRLATMDRNFRYSGDCEDYALRFADILITDYRMNPRDIRFVSGDFDNTETVGKHVWLEVNTIDKGWVVVNYYNVTDFNVYTDKFNYTNHSELKADERINLQTAYTEAMELRDQTKTVRNR